MVRTTAINVVRKVIFVSIINRLEQLAHDVRVCFAVSNKSALPNEGLAPKYRNTLFLWLAHNAVQ
jgi:hypothetical protein